MLPVINWNSLMINRDVVCFIRDSWGFMGIHGDSLVFVAEFRGFYEDLPGLMMI
jgi:hypothetical protein